ncbi:MAG: hypothetical protein KGQ82_07640, partial [Alphaproteobacteria bacterium]|nr:hypothetical protein [Alphaproteobacteria bacterium]
LARQVCQLAVESMENYFSGSGGLPEDMPECFLVSRVFAGLADDYCVQMEVTGSEIWRYSWFGNIYWEVNPSDEPSKSEGPGLSTPEYPPIPKEPAGFGSQKRIDLIIKSGDINKPYANARKNAPLPIKCLVEFKKGNEGGINEKGDLKKLRDLLSHLPLVPYGIFCSYIDAKEYAVLENWKAVAQRNNEIWVDGFEADLAGKKYRTFAIVFENRR